MRISLSLACLGLMTGTAFAAPQWATTINLSEGDDCAVIEDDATPGDNIYQVRSTNGSFPTTTFELPSGNLTINMLGGNDKVTFEGLDFPELTAGVFIYGGPGNDRATVRGLRSSGSVISDDNEGNNRLNVVRSAIAGDVAAYDGSGRQVVRVLGTTVDGSVLAASPDGASKVEIGRINQTSVVGGSVLIDNYGYGNDDVSLFGIVGGDFYASTGIGETKFQSLFSGVAGSLSVLVEGGTLAVSTGDVSIGDSLFAFCGEGETLKQIYNTAVGGVINFTSGFGYDDADLINVQTSELQINNGDGGSFLELRDGLTGPPFRLDIGRITSFSGQGADEVVFGSVGFPPATPAFIGSLDINCGDGNGRLEAGDNLTIGNVVYSSGGGFDEVRFEGTTIQDNLICYNFGGGSAVEIRDAYVGGLVDVNSLDGSDFFRVYDSEFIGPVYMFTNNGTDTFTLSNSTFASDFVADGGLDFDIFETTNDSVFGGIEYTPGWEFFFDF
ncbi:MAG: hypothetical protein AB8G99_01070 [Planctomycetaceae bacterium]